MPSGYTAPIVEKNLTFKQFVMLCARAFGACISMRDDSLDAEIPEKIEPMSTYHKDQLAKSKEELETLLAITTKKAKEQWAKKRLKQEIATTKKYKKEDDKRDDSNKYQAMLEKVIAWTPPSEDHRELKKFMENQIKETIKFDSHSTYWSDQLAALERKLENPLAYFNERVEKVKQDIKYHTEHWQKEVEQAERATRWLQQLRESLAKEAA